MVPLSSLIFQRSVLRVDEIKIVTCPSSTPVGIAHHLKCHVVVGTTNTMFGVGSCSQAGFTPCRISGSPLNREEGAVSSNAALLSLPLHRPKAKRSFPEQPRVELCPSRPCHGGYFQLLTPEIFQPRTSHSTCQSPRACSFVRLSEKSVISHNRTTQSRTSVQMGTLAQDF